MQLSARYVHQTGMKQRSLHRASGTNKKPLWAEIAIGVAVGAAVTVVASAAGALAALAWLNRVPGEVFACIDADDE